MHPAVSAWLDLLRLGAACVVFLGHAATQRISGGLGYQFAQYGEAAVDVFFIVSGFLIAHGTGGRGLRDFAAARLARVYSVVLPCLVLGWLMDLAGPGMDPALYAATPGFAGAAGLGQFLSSLGFLDHVWFRASQPGSNLPFWSLCLEAWFYLGFAVLVFVPRPWNWAGLALVLALAGPKTALLFPLWLMGGALRQVCARVAGTRMLGWVLLLAPVGLMVWWNPVGRGCFPYSALRLEAGCLWDLRFDYGVGVLVAAQVLGVHMLAPVLWPALRLVAPAVAWLAGASFTLYLLHFPLLHLLAALTPWAAEAWANRAVVFIVPPLAALLLAEVSERRRLAWRGAVLAVLPGR